MRRLTLVVVGALAVMLMACGEGDGAGEEAQSANEEASEQAPAASETDDAEEEEPTEPSGERSGELVLGMGFANSTMDPDLLPLQHMSTYLDPVYDALVRLDSEENPHPRLAESWEFGEDNGVPHLDVTLQDGLTFPDGAEFTAETVVANVERSVGLEGSTNAAWFAGVTVDVLDDLQVRFASEGGVGQLPRVLAGPAGMMISQTAIADEMDLTEGAAGIGPFTLASYEQNRLVYEANDDYWNPDDAAVDRIEIVYMPDDAMLNAVRAQEVDVTLLPVRMRPTIEEAGYETVSGPGDHGTFYVVNPDLPPFDDPRVREAVSLAIDREGFCASVWDGQCTPSGQFWGPNRPFYDPDIGIDDVPFDADAARDLVIEAGAEGANFEILTVAGIEWQQDIANYVSEQLRTIGLDPDVNPLPPPQLISSFAFEQNAAMTIGSSGLAFDPSVEVGRYLLPGGIYNVTDLTNDAISDLAAQGMLETDPDARNDIYREMSGLINEDRMIIPIVSQPKIYYLSPDVQGWTDPWGWQFVTLRGVGVAE